MAHTIGTINRIPAGDTTTYSTANPVTGSLLPTTGATLLIATILYSGGTDRTGGAPTFGDNTMIQADTARRGATSPEVSTEMWYLTASAISSASITGSWVSVPNGGAARIVVNLISAVAKPGKTSGVQVTTGSVNATTSTNPYCKITTTAGSTIIVETIANGANTWAPTGRTANWVNVNDNDIGTYGGGTQYLITDTVGVITGSWTFGTGEDWGIVMTAFGEAPPQVYANDSIQGQTSPEIELIAPVYLTVSNGTQEQTADILTLTQNYFLSQTGNISQLQVVDKPTLTQHGPTVDIKDIIQIQTANNVNLTQHHVLAIYNIAQIQTANTINLVQNNLLSPINSTQNQVSGNTILTQNFLLVLMIAIQLQTANNVTLGGGGVTKQMMHYIMMRRG